MEFRAPDSRLDDMQSNMITKADDQRKQKNNEDYADRVMKQVWLSLVCEKEGGSESGANPNRLSS